jgi:hypothetical protein
LDRVRNERPTPSEYPPEQEVFAYSFHLIDIASPLNNMKTLLIQVVATNGDEATIKLNKTLTETGLVPANWQVSLQSRMNITQYEHQTVKVAEEKPEYKPKGLEKYILDLMYARENFAPSPHEKGILTRIINNIKKKNE